MQYSYEDYRQKITETTKKYNDRAINFIRETKENLSDISIPVKELFDRNISNEQDKIILEEKGFFKLIQEKNQTIQSQDNPENYER